MPADLTALLILVLVFGAVAIAVFVFAQFAVARVRVRRRVATHARFADASPKAASGLDAFISTYFDEKRFGVEGTVRAELRRELIRAGFFRVDAVNYYIFARLASVVVLTTAGYLLVDQFLVNTQWYVKFGLVAVVMLLAVLGPDAYISRRKRKLHGGFRIAFPEMLDLMVVCVDAGLSIEAALDRVSREIARQDRYLGSNLLIMGGEMRAGRSTIDALASLADRLGLDEAHSLVAILRQSIELGTDVGDALHVFGDEMRDRRLLRAEQRANELPVKMVGPLSLFLFPVILGLVLLPLVIRLMAAAAGIGG
jgi:tight adherence protein C